MRLPDKKVQALVQHFIFHASIETWTHCLLCKVVGASFKKSLNFTYKWPGGSWFLQVFGGVTRMLKGMMEVIGPHTHLWVFVKGPSKVYGPFSPDGAPGMNLIGIALKEFPAQV